MTTLQREINILGEPTSDRNSKKTALQKIYQEVTNKNIDGQQVLSIFQVVSKHVLKTIMDPIEKCRELSVNILARFLFLKFSVVTRVDNVEEFLVLIMPIFVNQLAQIKVVEPSEVI
jgi:dynein assembly factor 5